jgi:hypothetical protein
VLASTETIDELPRAVSSQHSRASLWLCRRQLGHSRGQGLQHTSLPASARSSHWRRGLRGGGLHQHVHHPDVPRCDRPTGPCSCHCCS